MPKTVLGRSLGALLGSTKVPARATVPANRDAANGDKLGPGLETLLRTVRASEALPSSGTRSKAFRGDLGDLAAIPAWYFFGADLALLFLAGILVWPRAAELSPAKFVLAGIMVIIGALLAVIPLVRPTFERSCPEPQSKWVVARHGSGEAEKVLIACLPEPGFVGEVQRAANGRIRILPWSVEGLRPLSAEESQRCADEAAEVYREMIDHRGKEFRASLV